ncbi:MAG: hypothetical protein HY726_03760 [Candidatus Rokubacteria bacterium]|nr:hypothetical protein [Candidatus Rokubacteria bacterium]
MNRSLELRALVVEADRGLQELFEVLLKGWSLRFILDPWAEPDPPLGDVDLLVIDEDYSEGREESPPEWLESLTQRLPAIVLRTPALPLRTKPSILVLPKPFPVSRFLAFANTVRQAKANAVSPPEASA